MRHHVEAAATRRRTFIRTLLTSAGVWGLSVSRPGADAQSSGGKSTVDDDVRRASDEWFEALRQTDISAIDRLEADDFLTIQETAAGVAVIEKGTQIASLKSGKGTGVRLRRELSKVRIRHYGDTAILTGVALFHREAAVAKAPASQAVVTEVWIRQQNRWRIAHFATHPVRARVRQ